MSDLSPKTGSSRPEDASAEPLAGPLASAAGPATYDLRNPTMMVARPGLLMRLLGLLFRRVRFNEAQVQILLDLHADGRVVFVLPSQSLLDYVYFNWAFQKRGLRLAVFAKGMAMWPFRTVGATLHSLLRRLTRRRRPKADDKLLEHACRQNRPAFLFLRRRRSLFPGWGGDEDPLRTVVAVQKELTSTVLLVPLVLVWERAPGALRRGVLDRVFGDPDAPGRTRKIINFLRNYRRSLVQIGDPIPLAQFLREHAHLAAPALGQKLRWALNQRFRLERRVIQGPVLKSSATLREEIMRVESFRATAARLATETGQPLAQVRALAQGALNEIAADFKPSTIESLCIVLTFVFRRVYGGIDFRGEEGLREAARQAPLVILPSHKSHLDYLLVSYVFYINGLVPPHVAAGNNLDFWPLGYVFRRSGAFFLRRSFRQDAVYAATFRTYVQKLLKSGYTVEFFIEGGRSRTGRLLRPRYGLLGHVLDAVMEGHVGDLQLCPAAIGYEKIAEGGAYARELSGAKKKREGLSQLFGATRLLRERFGRVHVNFPRPFSLREFLAEAGVRPEEGFESEQQRRDLLKRLGYRVLGGIDDATVATPTSIVALALLGDPRRGLSRDFLRRRVGAVVETLLHTATPLASGVEVPLRANRVALGRTRRQGMGARAAALAAFDGHSDRAVALGEALSELIDETTALLVREGHLTATHYDDGGAVYEVPPERRLGLDYYRNNLIHVFVREAILAAALLRCWRSDEAFLDRLQAEARFLTQILKLEFVFQRGASFDEQFAMATADFEAAELVQRGAAGRLELPVKGRRTLRLLANMVLPVVESYYVVARGIGQMSEPVAEKPLLKQLQASGDRLWREGYLNFRESISSVTFGNALARFAEEGYVSSRRLPVGRKGKTQKIISPVDSGREGAAPVAPLLQRLERFLIPRDL